MKTNYLVLAYLFFDLRRRPRHSGSSICCAIAIAPLSFYPCHPCAWRNAPPYAFFDFVKSFLFVLFRFDQSYIHVIGLLSSIAIRMAAIPHRQHTL